MRNVLRAVSPALRGIAWCVMVMGMLAVAAPAQALKTCDPNISVIISLSTETDVVGYDLEWAPAPEGPWTLVNTEGVITPENAIVSVLLPGFQDIRYYRERARDSYGNISGWSPASEIVDYWQRELETPDPPIVSGVTVTVQVEFR